jgi:diphosphomevalonate decarboxylase
VSECDEDSYAFSFASPDYWRLADCIALVSQAHKPTGSTQGHALAHTSPIQTARVAGAPHRLDLCRKAILERDFDALAGVMELDSNLMHAVMMTSIPPLFYWQPATVDVLRLVPRWRQAGLPAGYTVDAGPNVHVICPAGAAPQVRDRLLAVPGVQQVLTASPGGPARLVEPPAGNELSC